MNTPQRTPRPTGGALSGVLRIAVALALLAGASFAQGPSSMQEKLRRQMEDISQLMRESERLLLEIAQSDKLADRQAELVRKLEELEREKPPRDAAAAEAKKRLEETREKQEELRQQQKEINRKLNELLQNQKQSSEMTVEKLVTLLANLPRQGGGGGQGKHKPKQRKPQREQKKDEQIRKEDQRPDQPRRDKDKRKSRRGQKKEDERRDENRGPEIDAWIARLPPAVQERINRNDLSDIPPLYRELVREYTTRRARREAKEEGDR